MAISRSASSISMFVRPIDRLPPLGDSRMKAVLVRGSYLKDGMISDLRRAVLLNFRKAGVTRSGA
jgi:hypothetical protein